MKTKFCIYLIYLITFPSTIHCWQTDTIIVFNPLHESFGVKMLNRGCSNDKYAKLEITSLLIPNYPIDMRKKAISGVVGITFNLDQSGNPENIKVLFASNPSLKAPVLEAVCGWKFDCVKLMGTDKQALKDAIFTYTFEFILDGPIDLGINNLFY